MTVADILLQDFDIEISNTRHTLERVPTGADTQPDWVPHEKSMKLGKLAMHCATLPLFGSYVLQDPDMDMAAPRHPHLDLVFTSREACLQLLEESAAKCRAALAATSDEAFATPWKFSYGRMVISDVARSLTYRMLFFNHLVHHTAQLGVYLRLLNLPVPALYGPSADEQWSSS